MSVQSLISFDDPPELSRSPAFHQDAAHPPTTPRRPEDHNNNQNNVHTDHHNPLNNGLLHCSLTQDSSPTCDTSSSLSPSSAGPAPGPSPGLLHLGPAHFNDLLVPSRPLEMPPPPLGTPCLSSASRSRSNSHVTTAGRKRAVGVFWDIQNCAATQPGQVANVVQNVRELYGDLDAVEGEFAVVCDVFGVHKPVIDMLNNLQADIFHVCSYSKNACDEKLKQLIYRFATLHGKHSVVVLISSDINFAPICSDLKYRQQVHVIIVHSQQVSPSLTVAANECRSFEDFRSGDKLIIDEKQLFACDNVEIVVTVSNWPTDYTPADAENLLTRFSQPLGGKVVWVNSRKRFGLILFKSPTDARRLVQNVHGRRIRGHSLIVKILQQDQPEGEAKDQDPVEQSSFEEDLVQIIEDSPKLELSIKDLHAKLLEKHSQKYHFGLQEFVTFLEAYNCKRIARKADTVRLEQFYYIAAIGLRMMKIFDSKPNPSPIDDLYEEYSRQYGLESRSLPEISECFKDIFWVFAMFDMKENVVLLKDFPASTAMVVKFGEEDWRRETAKILSVLGGKTMKLSKLYGRYSRKFDQIVASPIFRYKQLRHVFALTPVVAAVPAGIDGVNTDRFFSVAATPLYRLIDRCAAVLMKLSPEDGAGSFHDLNVEYWDTYGEELPNPLDYGFNDIAAMFESTGIFKIDVDRLKFVFPEFYQRPEKVKWEFDGFDGDDDDDDEDFDEDFDEGDDEEDESFAEEESSGELTDNEDSDEQEEDKDRKRKEFKDEDRYFGGKKQRRRRSFCQNSAMSSSRLGRS